MNFNEKFEYYKNMVDKELESIFSSCDLLQKSVYEAMQYSVLAGGKRIRPVLILAAADMLGGSLDDAKKVAVSLECIHTYSLIHDDLPCMDDDDLRRGLLTCHKKFGEATALLAGDGLLTFAFENLSDFEGYKTASAETVLKITNYIAKSSGAKGMIGGQVVDLESEGRGDLDEYTLSYIHERKTGALIRVSVVAGALIAGASEEEVNALSDFAQKIGLAFQIQDDILDFTGDEMTLGKPIGSDKENEKITYVTLMGIEKAEEKASHLTKSALESLNIFGQKADFLKELAKALLKRNN